MSDVGELYIRIGAFDGFRSLMWELGADPALAIAKAGVDEALWEDADAPIPVHQFRAALNIASDITGEGQFGLLLSQRQSFDKFGAVGYLAKHADTLADSIAQLGRYLCLHDASSVVSLDINEGIALWSHEMRGLSDVPSIHHAELAMGIAVKIIRTVVAPNWSPDVVYFVHSKPKNTAIYNRIFHCPVLFDQAVTAIEFPEATLRKPLLTADPALYRIIQSYLDRVENEKGNDFISVIRTTINNMLEEEKPTLDNAANRLGMNRSQVQRRLKREGTTFQDILQDVRFGLARKYLADTDLSLATIAAILGFAEPAVFSRAFRREAGKTPRAWRQDAKGGALAAE